MEKRFYKDSGKEISLLGFGLMRLPKLDAEKPNIDYSAAQEMIDYAYAHGVNYYDTAWPYHKGLSETFIGEAMKKYPRDSFFLASKLPGWEVKTLEDADRIFEEQLKKCQTQYFDFYLCHSLGDENYKIYREIDIYGLLMKKKQEGKIRNLGFSFHGDVPLLREIVCSHKWDFAQLQLNYLDWEMQDAKTKYEILTQNNIPCVVMEPVRGGALATLCDDAVKLLKNARPQATPASWAIRFAATLPNVMVVLSGMTTMEHVTDNISTMSVFEPITAQENKLLQQACDVYLQSKAVPCTGCRYCMDCPTGVDIPLMFKLYNEHATTENGDAFIAEYEKTDSSKHAEHCVSCKKCMENCPQSINIPERLADVGKLYKTLKSE